MMKGLSKAEQAMIGKLASLRQRVRELEQSEAESKKTELQEKAALEELQKSEERYRQVVENANDYMLSATTSWTEKCATTS